MALSRRRFTRHLLDRGECLPVSLSAPNLRDPVAAELVDVSLGCLAILLPAGTPLPEAGTTVRVGVPFPGLDADDAYPCEVAHAQETPDGPRVGLRFLGDGDALVHERRRRALADFLMSVHRARLSVWAAASH
jgi:hypothetical protein